MAFLNSYYREVKLYEYLHEWGLPETNDAIAVAFSKLGDEQGKRMENWIWVPEKKTGIHFTKVSRRG